MLVLKSADLMIVGMLALFAVGILVSPSYAEIDLETCVGMWLFDEGEGDTAEDSSVSKNDGTLMNDPKWVDGKFGSALEFDGVDDRIEVPYHESLNLTTDLTIAAWVKLNNYVDNPQLVSKAGQGWEPYRVEFTSGNTLLWASNAANNREGIGSGMPPGLNSWKHVAITFSNGNTVFYLDGTETAKAKSNIIPLKTTTSGLLFIGARSATSPNYLDGLIDEVAIFNVALTERDIQNIANKGLEEAISPTGVNLSGKLTTAWGSVKTQD
jgi:hypothetical protein